MSIRIVLSSLAMVGFLPGQDLEDIETTFPNSYVASATETLSPVAVNAHTPTGFSESLGAAAWYSIDGSNSGSFLDNVLVAGLYSNGDAGLHHFVRPATLSGGPYVLTSARSFASPWVPSGVAYDSVDDQLYIVDRTSRMIHTAAWDGESDLGAVLWQTFYDASPFVTSSHSPSLQLLGGINPTGGASAPRSTAATQLRVAPAMRSAHFLLGLPHLVIIDLATALDTGFSPTVPSGDNFILDPVSFRDGATSVRAFVGDNSTHTYVLTRTDTGAVLGTTTQGLTDNEIVVPSSEPLQVGVVYGVHRTSATSDVHKQRCMVRYGIPGELVPGTGYIEMGRLQSTGSWKAGEDVQMSCLIKSSASSPVLIATALTFGSRDPGGVDPVMPVGPDLYMISTGATLPTQLDAVEGTYGSWMVYDPITLPSTPGSVGQVLLLQGIVVDPAGGAYFSDIVGGLVLAP